MWSTILIPEAGALRHITQRVLSVRLKIVIGSLQLQVKIARLLILRVDQ